MIYPYMLIVLSSILDFFLTKTLIGEGDFFAEANPLQRYPMMWSNSVWSLLVFKLFFLVFGAIIGYIIYTNNKYNYLQMIVTRVLWGVGVFQASVAVYGAYLVLAFT